MCCPPYCSCSWWSSRIIIIYYNTLVVMTAGWAAPKLLWTPIYIYIYYEPVLQEHDHDSRLHRLGHMKTIVDVMSGIPRWPWDWNPPGVWPPYKSFLAASRDGELDACYVALTLELSKCCDFPKSSQPTSRSILFFAWILLCHILVFIVHHGVRQVTGTEELERPSSSTGYLGFWTRSGYHRTQW